ncbi:UNVERIFIED_CONTAM: hypothetical protein RF648_17950 [Kocuria sp. CPCC 205274]
MAKFIKLESGRIINTDMIVSVVGATNDKYSQQVSMANGKYYLITEKDAARFGDIIGLELGGENDITTQD